MAMLLNKHPSCLFSRTFQCYSRKLSQNSCKYLVNSSFCINKRYSLISRSGRWWRDEKSLFAPIENFSNGAFDLKGFSSSLRLINVREKRRFLGQPVNVGITSASAVCYYGSSLREKIFSENNQKRNHSNRGYSSKTQSNDENEVEFTLFGRFFMALLFSCPLSALLWVFKISKGDDGGSFNAEKNGRREIFFDPEDSRETKALENYQYLLKSLTKREEKHTIILNHLGRTQKVSLLIQRSFRLIYTLFVFLPVMASIPLVLFGERGINIWYMVVKSSIERAGCTYIKLGQWASHRPDIFPEKLCDCLGSLRNDSPTHGIEDSASIIRKSFNYELEEIFIEFDPIPIASGSIAQIHKARLKPEFLPKELESDVVAVKVRHPGVERNLQFDLELLLRFGNLISNIPGLSFFRVPVVVDEFSKILAEQADLSNEANHLQRFKDNFKNTSINVRFPDVIPSLVSHEVFVQTWEEGESIQKYVDVSHPQNRYLASLGYDIFMNMLVNHNFIHADCHAGNIFVQGDINKNKSTSPKMLMFDAGLVTSLSKAERVHLVSLLKDVVNADGRHAAEMFMNLSHTVCENSASFVEEMKLLFIEKCQTKRIHDKIIGDNNVSERQPIHLGELISEVMALVRNHGMELESDFASIIVSMSLLERLARNLDPKIDLVASLVPFLFRNPLAMVNLAKDTFDAGFLTAKNALFFVDQLRNLNCHFE